MNQTAADIYEIAMGRWSRRLARAFLHFVGAPAQGQLIDIGCGTGSLTLSAATRYPDASVLGIDLMPEYLTEALRNTFDNARFETGDAHDMPFENASFDAAFSQLVLNDLHHPRQALDEMIRITRPGGLVAAAVWDRTGGLTFLRLFLDAAAVLIPNDGENLRRKVFDVPYQSEDNLLDLWEDAGLLDVETSTLSIRMDFIDFDDYWQSLLGAHSLIRDFYANLDHEKAAPLHQAVKHAFLSGRDDGRRSLVASALAVRGTVPDPS